VLEVEQEGEERGGGQGAVGGERRGGEQEQANQKAVVLRVGVRRVKGALCA